MKLEEIKAEILARRNEWASKNDDYETASFIAYDTCLNMLDQLEPSWHKYPDEKPTEDGYYETTTPKGKVKQDWWNGSEFEELDEQPIAWKELDKPYSKEEQCQAEDHQ